MAQPLVSVAPSTIIDGRSLVAIVAAPLVHHTGPSFDTGADLTAHPYRIKYGYTPHATTGNPAPASVTRIAALTVTDSANGHFTAPTIGVVSNTPGFVTLQVNDGGWADAGDPFPVLLTKPSDVPISPMVESILAMPMIAGASEDLIGVDVGICATIKISYPQVNPDGSILVRILETPLAFVSQTHVSFTMPDFGVDADVEGSVTLQYVIAGQTYNTLPFAVDIGPIVDTSPPAPEPAPTYGYGIPVGPMDYPPGRVPWVFIDPYDPDEATNTYTVPINPNKMTSPFPTRVITAAFTTAVTGQTLLTEGARTPAQWQFSGEIFDAAHYDALRSWVYDRNRRIIVQDHFGRPITCVLMFFDAQPKQILKKYWRHTYTITALVVDVGRPTQIPVVSP